MEERLTARGCPPPNRQLQAGALVDATLQAACSTLDKLFGTRPGVSCALASGREKQLACLQTTPLLIRPHQRPTHAQA